MNSNNRNLNYLYESNHNCNKSYKTRINRNNSFVDIYSCENNRNCKLRMNNLENRISSLEKMLQYLDEFILNGMNVGDDTYNLGDLIEDRYDYCTYYHTFKLVNNWDTFLFFSPRDIRGLIFDFSYLYSDGKVICYNGLNGPKNLEKVTEYTIEEFLNEYGLSRLFSVSHWNVNWEKLGVNWNN